MAQSRLSEAVKKVLVQMAGQADIFPIGMDTLSIEQDGIPDSGSSGIFKPEHGEVELNRLPAAARDQRIPLQWHAARRLHVESGKRTRAVQLSHAACAS